jgi:hypothetical protein
MGIFPMMMVVQVLCKNIQRDEQKAGKEACSFH